LSLDRSILLLWRGIFSGENGLYTTGKFTPRKQDAVPAAPAFQADIGAEPDDRPFIAPAGMRFSQRNGIVYLQVWKHGKPEWKTVSQTAGGLYRKHFLIVVPQRSYIGAG
jgi:hypothetical protein